MTVETNYEIEIGLRSAIVLKISKNFFTQREALRTKINCTLCARSFLRFEQMRVIVRNSD